MIGQILNKFIGKDRFKKMNQVVLGINVKLYGKSNNYNEMTKAITEITNSELGVKPDHVYVSYSEFDNWGWNGNNF